MSARPRRRTAKWAGWSDETIAEGRAHLRHVWDCELRQIGEECNACRAAMEFVARLVPLYDPFATAEDCAFDYRLARDAVGYFHDHLGFIEGERAGDPFDLEPWQAAAPANLFGWLRPQEVATPERPDPPPPIRRYRQFFMLVAAKNGKSPLIAGIALYLLICDHEPGAQVYTAAGEKDQAAIIYRHASEMLTRNEEMSAHCIVYPSRKSIEVPSTVSFLRVLSSDARTKHGINAHGVFCDELHAFKNRRLYDVLKTRQSSRRQPVLGVITTADYERPSICNELYSLACKVRDGTLKARQFLPIVYEAKLGDDITSPKTWRKANPNLGVSVRVDALEEDSAQAKHSPGYRDEFLRTNLCVRTNARVAAIDMVRWRLCSGGPAGGLRRRDWKSLRELLRGHRCYAGLDLASTSDLAALALYFPDDFAALWWNWCPRDSARDRQERDGVPYLDWAEQKALILTGEGPDERSVDYRVVRAGIADTCKEYGVTELAFDRFGSNETLTALRDDYGIKVLKFGQSFVSMNAPAKELDRLVNGAAQLAHGEDPIATWAASNLVWKIDDVGNWMPSRRRSTEKIDPMVALLMAIGAYMLQPAKPKKSVYDTPGRGTLVQ